MPIQFRCKHCGQLLSITRRKAGQEVTCPQCAHRTRVPELQSASAGSIASDEPEESDSTTAEVAGKGIDQADSQQAWERHPNPWLNEDDEEEDEFRIASAGLEESGLDMTPMVDVTFLLLIFFMITASFSMQKSMETTPPKKDEEGAAQTMQIEDLEEESVVVSIDEENNIFVDDVAVAGLGELVDALRSKIANEGKNELLIEAHPLATHGRIVAVTDAGLKADMQRIRRSSLAGED